MDTPPESSPHAADVLNDRVELTIAAAAAIVSVIGDYDLSHADELSSALASATVQRTHLIIDFTRCTLLDSTGVALLINADMRARGARGQLRLVIPPDGAVARVAGLIRLGDLVPISESLDDALGAQPA